ncbi:MAG: hypothetical protein HY268_10870 [Deltaproteobacteria bacterium]|nr:hypothetical protein [Deltaproteobacteria bacterium]
MTGCLSHEITARLDRAMRQLPVVVLSDNGKEAVKLDDRLWALPMGQLLE